MILFFTFFLSCFLLSFTRASLSFSSSFLVFVPLFFFLLIPFNGGSFSANWLSWLGSVGSGLTSWGFNLDTLSAFMLLLITLVFATVFFFSLSYVGQDPSLLLFLSYLFLFSLFMFVLVTAPSLLQMFLGWEGVGLCSYLLINFWCGRVWANRAAIKAMVLNKVGDVALLGAMGALVFVVGSYGWVELSIWPFLGLAACFLFLIAVMAKSAQLLLHFWLPDAMEGPTPVSALIHAATMVTAGVFFLLRGSALWVYSSFSLVLIILGGLTAFYASLCALSQWDYKKVVAYSTCSQLGYMVLICGFQGYEHSLFHLFNHGFFKALLFLGAGFTIYLWSDEQDIRRGGGLLLKSPLIYLFALTASLALMGFPFLTGFYSKDLLLELLLSSHKWGWGAWLAYLAAFCTVSYSLKLLWVSTFNFPLSSPSRYVSSSFPYFFLLLFLLFFFSLFAGWFFSFSWSVARGFLVGPFTFLVPLFLLLLGFLYALFSFFYHTHSFSRFLFSYFSHLAYLDFLLGSISHLSLFWSFSTAYKQLDLSFLPKALPQFISSTPHFYTIFVAPFVSYNLVLFLLILVSFFSYFFFFSFL